MPNQTPASLPPLSTVSLTATGAIAANRFVTPAGAQAGADANALGVSRTAAAIGEVIPVDSNGYCIVEAGAAIAAGATIKSDASGRAITWVTSGARLGIAMAAASGAGYYIEAQMIPNAA